MHQSCVPYARGSCPYAGTQVANIQGNNTIVWLSTVAQESLDHVLVVCLLRWAVVSLCHDPQVRQQGS